MKKVLIFILISAGVLKAYGQDTLFKKDNSVIIAKVLEINPDEIKYKRFDFQDGPTYIEKKSAFRMVVYASGMRETFSEGDKPAGPDKPSPSVSQGTDYYDRSNRETSGKIEQVGARYRFNDVRMSERDIHKVLIKTMDKQIIMHVGKAKDNNKLQYIGFAGIPLGMASFLLFSNSFSYSRPMSSSRQSTLQAASAVCLVAAISCPIASGIFKKNRHRHTQEAIALYNQRY